MPDELTDRLLIKLGEAIELLRRVHAQAGNHSERRHVLPAELRDEIQEFLGGPEDEQG